MIYLLDTNIFREMLEHFPKRGKTFEEIWERFEKGINKFLKNFLILSNFPRELSTF